MKNFFIGCQWGKRRPGCHAWLRVLSYTTGATSEFRVTSELPLALTIVKICTYEPDTQLTRSKVESSNISLFYQERARTRKLSISRTTCNWSRVSTCQPLRGTITYFYLCGQQLEVWLKYKLFFSERHSYWRPSRFWTVMIFAPKLGANFLSKSHHACEKQK